MMNYGHIYGIALNDVKEFTKMGTEFHSKPYLSAPKSPVIYMKTRTSFARNHVFVQDGDVLHASATLALLIGRDTTLCSPDDAMKHIGAASLAIDFTLPQPGYYRPAVAFAGRDGFLTAGEWQPYRLPEKIETRINGHLAHAWSLDRLYRQPARLIADLSAFMTLKAGDVLLVGLPGDAPSVRPGQSIVVTADGLGSVETTIKVKTP